MRKALLLGFALVVLLTGCGAEAQSSASSQTQPPAATPLPPDPRLAQAQENNPDTVAWLTVPGTNIDGPVQQAGDNEYYLRRTELGEPSNEGCFFADYECAFGGEELSTNTIIYGHTFTRPGQDPNIGFGQLNAFLDPDFADKNPQIFLSVQEQKYAFEIKSVGVVNTDRDQVCILADPSWAQHQKLVRLANERNVLKERGLEAAGGQKLLTLSTCTGDNAERLLLVAELTQ